LAIIFAPKKFHQFLYGRRFVLVTDYKLLNALFRPSKGTPALAANRLTRWALLLSQYGCTIEYRKTSRHGNADALSRLPVGSDSAFDSEELDDDFSVVCSINTIGQKLNATDPGIFSNESAKDLVLPAVTRFCREGWPPKDASSARLRGEMQRTSDSVNEEIRGTGVSPNDFGEIARSLLPSPVHLAPGRQARSATESQSTVAGVPTVTSLRSATRKGSHATRSILAPVAIRTLVGYLPLSRKCAVVDR